MITDTIERAPSTVAAPAVVDGLPEAEYHAHTALSSSGARDLLPPSTPAKFRYKRDHPEAPTRDMQLGSCVHRDILGVGQDYEVCEHESRQTKAAKEEVAAIEAKGMIALRPSEYVLVRGMVTAVLDHPDAGPLFADGVGTPERSLFWQDQATGVECRARIDWYLNNGRAAIDLKTAHTAAPSALPRHVANFGYAVQNAWYDDGMRAVGLGDDTTAFVFVFVEKDPPHLVSVNRMHPDDVEWARRQAAFAREVFRDCTESGIWPGYPTGIGTIRLPGWARREHEEDITW